jgi:MFS family permease
MTTPSVQGTRSDYSQGYRAWVLAMLFLIYMLNYIDRALLNIVGQAVKQDLGLSDLQLGLAAGLAFAILNGVASIPIARLSEHMSRVTIVSVALAVWSGMTAVCGLAQNFWHLILARAGVGIGEAGGLAPSQSLIADYFPAEKRASAAAIFGTATPTGMLIGALASGWITEHFSWRTAFFAIGLPGIVVALVAALTIKDPPRGHSDGVVLEGKPPSFAATLKHILKQSPILHMLAGGTLLNFAFFGYITFLHPLLFRSMGMSYGEAATFYGLVTGLACGVGYLIGGFVADALGRGDKIWYGLVPALGSLVAAPAFFVGFTQTNPASAAIFFVIGGIGATTWYGPTMSIVHGLMESRMRATATALIGFVMLIFGVAMGPAIVGLLSDDFGAMLTTQPCPAPNLCGANGNEGLRLALIVVTPLYLWAAIHYALAARGLSRTARGNTEAPHSKPAAQAPSSS